jgi:hypothetical protein
MFEAQIALTIGLIAGLILGWLTAGMQWYVERTRCVRLKLAFGRSNAQQLMVVASYDSE